MVKNNPLIKCIHYFLMFLAIFETLCALANDDSRLCYKLMLDMDIYILKSRVPFHNDLRFVILVVANPFNPWIL